MNMLKGVWKLIRPLNLAILLITLFMLHGVAYQRMYFPRDYAFGMPVMHFWLFVLATLLAAAAGNMFNDLTDREIDRINRPGKAVLGTLLSPLSAFRMAWAFNAAGIAIALFLSFSAGNISLFAIYILAISLLYGYSTFFKPIPFLGNFVIALLVMLVLFSLWLFDMYFAIYSASYELIPGRRILYVTVFYAAFAFMVSLIREIVKDMADKEGDSLNNRRTLAIVWKDTNVRFLLLLLCFALLGGVFYFQLWLVNEGFGVVTAFLALTEILGVVAILKLLGAQEKEDYDNLSKLFKWIMLAGIAAGYMFLVR
jgi:4-hydroxybenzoate polyprenyltransferase